MRKDLEKVCKLYKAKNEGAVRLGDCPVGLFLYEGTLVMKTQYKTKLSTEEYRDECYIVESGETFWGGTDTNEAYHNLMVTPVILGYGLSRLTKVKDVTGESLPINKEEEAPKTGLASVYEDIGNGK